MIRAFTILVDEKAMEIDKELNYTFKPMEEHLHQAIQKYYKEALL